MKDFSQNHPKGVLLRQTDPAGLMCFPARYYLIVRLCINYILLVESYQIFSRMLMLVFPGKAHDADGNGFFSLNAALESIFSRSHAKEPVSLARVQTGGNRSL